jgi:hypothetical protein
MDRYITRSFGDLSPSHFYDNILRIVGRQNRADALHIDSAYKSDCKAFLSRDKKDILSKRIDLEAMLGIRFFHPDDWHPFLDSFSLNPTHLRKFKLARLSDSVSLDQVRAS